MKPRPARRGRGLRNLGAQRPLIATVTAALLSLTVAIPAQAEWFLDRLNNGKWTWPGAVAPITATLLIEGLCWLGAFLYADSVTRTPVRLYRATTFAFALLAAAINYSHGSSINPAVGVTYALASLMGVGAFELYMHRTRHVATGMSLDEIRLWALRWRRHPRVMREVGRIRATHGLAVGRETAWRMAYLRVKGNPTVPIAISSALVTRVIHSPSSTPKVAHPEPPTEPATVAEPAATEPMPETARGVDVREHLVSWKDAEELERMLATGWPTPEPDDSKPTSSVRKTRTTAATTRRDSSAEQAVTSAVPRGKRNQRGSKTGTGKVRFTATKTELDGPGDARDRILRYLNRAEAKGHPIAELDRKHIAEQFRVSDRYVRDVISTHNTAKEGQ